MKRKIVMGKGRGWSMVVLILMVGLFVLSLAAAGVGKESFVEGGRSMGKHGNIDPLASLEGRAAGPIGSSASASRV